MLLPDTRTEPIEIIDHLTALRMCVVEKDSVAHLDGSWDVPGAYVLLDPPDAAGGYGVYVGKAPAGIRSRLLDHERKRTWLRGLLIRRDVSTGLSSAQAGWLEGDLYQLFHSADRATLHNAVQPRDDTVPSYELRILETFRDPINRVLRLLGYDTGTADDTQVHAPRRTSTFHGITMGQLLEAGLVQPGERLISTNGAWPASAVVLPNAKIDYNGGAYDTPSSAAQAVKNGAAVNGWDFWAVERSTGSERLSSLRTALADSVTRTIATP
ncbi:hypothetical protein [Cellulomonas sp. Leaf395]|uniref:restriction system modified-DNA reader domain-containing protein n=1 Tax=Cellulomonas sp. Leaf395 TaxID=1736362 RepID=UPI0012FB31E1|nr:hypothetical protein [Cellulomonas sp. Leaf395]